MTGNLLILAPVAVLPVIVFLVLLDRFDDHNLIRYYHIIPTVIIGAPLAVLAYYINGEALFELNLDYRMYSRFGAPLVEECLKGAVIFYFFWSNRIGYATDAAIRGFAIGTGFAVVENIYYLFQAVDFRVASWIIRGFGTAIMHGGATAIFGVMAAQLTEENHKFSPIYFVPGMIVAATIHSVFNHFPGSPALSAFGSTVVIIAALAWLFRGDKTNISDDLKSDLEEHQELYERLLADRHLESDDGTLTADLHTEFEAWLVDDVVRYMHLHTELVITAEKRILAWKEGDTTPVGPDILNRFSELKDLAAMLGDPVIERLLPKMKMSRQELWKLYMLESRANQETLSSDTGAKLGPHAADTED